MVNLLDPGGEQPVQLAQAGEGPPGLAVGGGELDCEPVVYGPEEPLDLAPALRLTGQSQLILWITRGAGVPAATARIGVRARAGG
jgi:hypothetical protein